MARQNLGAAASASDELARIADLTNANLADMAQATIKGRAAGAGTGDPTDLTEAQVIAILATAFPLGVGAWTSYTPTLTQSATVSKTVNRAVYTQIGKTVFGQVLVTATSNGTASNEIRLGLPVAASGSGPIIGDGFIYDASTGSVFKAQAKLDATTYITFLASNDNLLTRIGAAGSIFSVGLDGTGGDQVSANFVYEAA